MGLDYTTANTGIFVRGGKVIKTVNAHQTMPETTLPAELKQIVDPFEAADMTDQVVTVYPLFAAAQNDQVAFRQNVAAIWDAILTDINSVVSQMRLTQPGIDQAFWEEFWRNMVADAQSIDASVVTLGTVTADGANHGTGTVLVSKLLDGFNPPIANGPALIHYWNVSSELAVNETMVFECIADAASGAASGQETFSWRGQIAYPELDWHAEGSGDGPTLSVVGDSGIVDDGGLENWDSATAPSNWTFSMGAVAAMVSQQTKVADATKVYRGNSSLKFLGDGVSECTLEQDITGRLDLGRLYLLTCQIKCSANAPAAGSFDITVNLKLQDGTTSTDTISVGHASFTTSWVRQRLFFLTPLQGIVDAEIYFECLDGLTNAVSLWVDEIKLVPMTYHGGIAAVVLPGQTDFLREDRFTLANTNDDAGTFQKFFRRHYGVQLRSNAAAGETILDSLAE